ncbi:MAG: NAD-dependent epimerase/dehydratase family protein [Planctomycetota bacterium]
MNILVTGGSGFIGSHVVDALRAHGHEVRVYDMRPPAFRNDVEFAKGDLLDAETLTAAMAGVEAVFHLAAVADVKDVAANPRRAHDVNVTGTLNVLDAARGRVGRVIYASTVWVYEGASHVDVDEDTPLGPPPHLYTAQKLAGEHYCHAYRKLYGLETTILRYGVPFGPRARDAAVVPLMVGKAFRGESLTIAGDGAQYRYFIYVEDLAEGNVAALAPAAANRAYNLDGSEKITIRRLADLVRKTVRDVPLSSVPARPGDFSGKTVSSARAKAELGWAPDVPFEEGLRRYVAWFREREKERGVSE